jgi:DNA repair photolyase
MAANELPVRGRGSVHNPPNRFETIHYERTLDDEGPEGVAPATQFLRDTSRSIISYNDSPDVGFSASVNPYRGCEHGCAYCYARPYHEYLGFSAGLDFETRILVKEDAPELLRRELASPRWRPQPIGMSGVTDCYQPAERRFRLTRRCLEVLAEFRNPVAIVTKNQLVTRDIDLLSELARHKAAAVFCSITSLDGHLARLLEPRTTQPRGRLEAVRKLADAGVPVGVMAAPMIPGLNDHELPAILAAAADAGARHAGYVPLRLPYGVGPLFETWLTCHFPDKKDKVLSRIREMRGGRLNDPRFGSRMHGEGAIADLLQNLFDLTCSRLGLNSDDLALSPDAFRRTGRQPTLFE